MCVPLVDGVSVEESPFVASEPAVDAFRDAPVISLTEYHDVRTVIDPLD